MAVKTAITIAGAGVQLSQIVVIRRLLSGEALPWSIILLTPNNGYVEQENFATEAERDARFQFWMEAVENATTFAEGVEGTWALTDAPAAGVAASVTKAAAGVGLKNIITSLTISLGPGAVDPVASSLLFQLRDGTTPIWSMRLETKKGGDGLRFTQPCAFASQENSPFTLETVGAPVANTYATVSMNGHVE